MAQETSPPRLDLEMARRLHQLVTGYRASQVVSTVARFRIADRLASGLLTLDHLAVRLDIPHDQLYRLLRAAVAIGVLDEVEPRTFALTDLGRPLRSDVPGSLRSYAMAVTAPGHWLPWARLPHAMVSRQAQVEPTLGAGIFEYYREHPEEAQLFAEAMTSLTELLAADIVRLYDFSPFRLVVDVGGSHGALLAAVLEANLEARGALLDRPEVAEAACRHLDDRGLAERSEVIGGDFFQSVPPGGDVYLLKHVLHDWPDDKASLILEQCRQAMDGDGRVVVVETVLPPEGEPARPSLSDLNMLVVTGGRERTAEGYAALFASSGLRLEEVIPLAVEPEAAILVGAPA